MRASVRGYVVAILRSWMAGPLAAMVLADNGADVVKVEPPRAGPRAAPTVPDVEPRQAASPSTQDSKGAHPRTRFYERPM
jgi:crotonobetainyl-CoA:carnitine CoA-transferase CaiB-like acyl-CoA transferase